MSPDEQSMKLNAAIQQQMGALMIEQLAAQIREESLQGRLAALEAESEARKPPAAKAKGAT